MANEKGTGRGGKYNFPNANREPQTLEELNAIQRAVREAIHAYRQPRVKDDKELMDRFDEYFDRCYEYGIKPTVEEMMLYTGYGHSYMNDIETGRKKGFTPNTGIIIKKAKEIMKTIDAKMVENGEVNPIVYFFRAKNYYGMVDKVEHIIAPPVENELIDTKSIKERYQLEDSIDVEIKKD